MPTSPPNLAPGDRVRIVAPSGVFDRALFEAGIARIRAAGLEPVYDDGLFAQHHYLAGSDERRLAELHAALDDNEARAIWTARGGYGATRLLPALEIGRIRDNPKWLVGFSDATALHAAWSRAGLCSIHGANVTTIDTWSEQARGELFDCLFHATSPTLSGSAARGNAPVSGPLLGGNLTVLAAMAGTTFLPDVEGAIVLLEDIGERPYRLDRSLTQLLQAGHLDGAAGFVIGQLTGCAEPGDKEVDFDALGIVIDRLDAGDVPILTGLPVGHENDSHALIIGQNVSLDPGQGMLSKYHGE